jgi:uncharacterized protein YqeY
MSLKEKLTEDLKESMKSKDEIRKNTVQLIRSSILQIEKDKRIVLDEDGVLDVIAKELKKRKDALPEYEKSGRQDLIDNLKKEIEIIKGYLPEQLSVEELAVIVKKAIEDTEANSIKDMGKIMAAVMPQTKGRADGKAINEIARKYLN